MSTRSARRSTSSTGSGGPRRGGDVLEIRAGDTIHTPPGEWHWHGASPERFLTHLTIYEAANDGSETERGARISDEEYARAPADR
jgi:quercetin dioxygenase-like cupin family protein